jgi:hypothetical protein
MFFFGIGYLENLVGFFLALVLASKSEGFRVVKMMG